MKSCFYRKKNPIKVSNQDIFHSAHNLKAKVEGEILQFSLKHVTNSKKNHPGISDLQNFLQRLRHFSNKLISSRKYSFSMRRFGDIPRYVSGNDLYEWHPLWQTLAQCNPSIAVLICVKTFKYCMIIYAFFFFTFLKRQFFCYSYVQLSSVIREREKDVRLMTGRLQRRGGAQSERQSRCNFRFVNAATRQRRATPCGQPSS